MFNEANEMVDQLQLANFETMLIHNTDGLIDGTIDGTYRSALQ